jgi:hypothetical protein
MKQATEYVRGLRYKLRMMGIKIDEPAFVFGDNKSLLCNTDGPYVSGTCMSSLTQDSNSYT